MELCFNPIGNKHKQKVDCCPAFSELFKQNTSLLHMDMSVCGFTSTDCEKLSVGLNQNHSLIGLHFNGNGKGVDEYGFLSIDCSEEDPIKLSFLRPL